MQKIQNPLKYELLYQGGWEVFFNGKKTLVLVGLWLFLPSVCYRGKIRDIKLPIVFKNDIKINQSDILAKYILSFSL